MERNEQDIFDELVREKLAGYTEPPDPAWIKNIHAKKSRVINLYHLYRLMLITALVGAGIFSSVYFFTPQQDITSDMMNDNSVTVSELGTAEAEGIQPTDNTEFVAVFDHTSFAAQSSAGQRSNTSSSVSNTGNNNTQSVNNNTLNTGNTATSGSKTGMAPFRTIPSGSGKTNNSVSNTTVDKATKTAAQTTNTPKDSKNEAPAADPDRKTNTSKDLNPGLQSDSVSSNTGKNSTAEAKNDGDKDVKEKEEVLTCNAAFDFYTSYTGEVSFTNMSTAAPNATMSWNFGDGDRSVHNDPSHQFPKTGTYEVTLYVKDDKHNCEDSYTRTITFRNPEDKEVPVAINGVLYAGGTVVKKGVIELFVFDDEKGVYVNTQNVKTSQTGEFSIPIQKGQRYVLRGNPTSTEENYQATFWGNTTEIESASDVVAMLSEDQDLIGYNIDLQMGEKQGENDELNPVNPIAGNEQSILLLDANNNIVSVATIDANGNYNFGDVDPGSYTVLNPATGATSSKVISGTGSTGNTGKATGNIYSSSGASGTSGSLASDEKVTVYPNPANTLVNFGINSASGEQGTIVIMNAGGVEISRQVKTFVAGFNQTQYDLSAYPPGVYYVLVFKGNQQVLSNRVVKLAADPK